MPPQTPTPQPTPTPTPDFSKAFVGGAPPPQGFAPPQPTQGPADYSKAFVDDSTSTSGGGPVRNLPDPSVVSPQAQQQLDASQMGPMARDANTAASGFLSGISGLPQSVNQQGDQQPTTMDYVKQAASGLLGPAIPIARGLFGLAHNVSEVATPTQPTEDPQDAMERRLNSGSQLAGNVAGAALLDRMGRALPESAPAATPAPAPSAPVVRAPVVKSPQPNGLPGMNLPADPGFGINTRQLQGTVQPTSTGGPIHITLGDAPSPAQSTGQNLNFANRTDSGSLLQPTPPEPPPPGPPALLKYPEWPTRMAHDAARNPAPPPAPVKPEVTPMQQWPTEPQHAAVRGAQATVDRSNARPFVPMSESPVKPPTPAPEPEPPGPPDFSRISEGPTAQMHSAVRGAQSQVARTNARQIFPLRETPNKPPDVDGAESTQAPGVQLNAERNESIGSDNIIRPPDAPSQTPAGNAIPQAPRPNVNSPIVSPESQATPQKVTYQSVEKTDLLQLVRKGDRGAIQEWQRRGLPLPENLKFMVEPNKPNVPWRNYER